MSLRRHDLRWGVTAWQVTLVIGFGLITAGLVAANQPPPDAALVGSETCLACHEEYGEAFKQTIHGLAYEVDDPRAVLSCESCHGPGSVHAEEMDPELIFNPAKADQFNDQNLCVTCHNTAMFDSWAFSAHHNADVNCTECHAIHVTYEKSLKKPMPELCYDCHTDVRAAFFMPSHHPVREGKLECLDCHGIHGSGGRMTMDNTGREACFSCHAEKEGPFVYEHAPVMEDCTICHSPHGSVANSLLTQTEPALCLNCHAMHFHATIEGVDGVFEVPNNRPRDSYSTPDGWKKGMLTRCTQCHTEIHGSDVPSQAITTSGNALTR